MDIFLFFLLSLSVSATPKTWKKPIYTLDLSI